MIAQVFPGLDGKAASYGWVGGMDFSAFRIRVDGYKEDWKKENLSTARTIRPSR